MSRPRDLRIVRKPAEERRLVNKATPEQRVRGLLACGFWTAWIREQTIQSLLDDPETREATIVQLNLRRDLAAVN